MGEPQSLRHDARMLVSRAALESRLIGWGREYGGGKYEHNGWKTRNLIQTLMEFGGFVPESGGFLPNPVRSAADEVEDVVRSMERGGYFVHTRILRCDYFEPKWAMDMRLDTLRKLGIGVSKAGYYLKLNEAKLFVAGALHIACV